MDALQCDEATGFVVNEMARKFAFYLWFALALICF